MTTVFYIDTWVDGKTPAYQGVIDRCLILEMEADFVDQAAGRVYFGKTRSKNWRNMNSPRGRFFLDKETALQELKKLLIEAINEAASRSRDLVKRYEFAFQEKECIRKSPS